MRALGILVLLLFPVSAMAETRTVGPTGTYAKPCEAFAAAQPGDTVEIDAAGNGTYDGDVCAITTDNLTIKGTGAGRAHIAAAGNTAQGKAIWVIQGANTRVENIELSGATAPDNNGAGIRQEGAGLTLVNDFFHDDQDGVLAGDNADSDVVIDSTEFARNGTTDGQAHNFYINHVRSLTVQYSYSHDAIVGHLGKSRALTNTIVYNRFSEENGSGSYELDLPNGGVARLVGNIFQQGANSQNPALVAYGEEGGLNPGSTLQVVNNTFVNDKPGNATAILLGGDFTATALIQNNLWAGLSTTVSRTDGQDFRSNCGPQDPLFVKRSAFDYRLLPGSPCAVIGTTPDAGLAPTQVYVQPLGHTARTDNGLADGAVPVDSNAKPAPTPKPVVKPKAGPHAVGRKVDVFGRKAYVLIQCNTKACKGTVKLGALGKATFSIAAGKSRTITVRLKTKLKKTSVKVTAHIGGHKVKLTLVRKPK